MDNLFECKWSEQGEVACYRNARDSGFCQWHEIRDRIERIIRLQSPSFWGETGIFYLVTLLTVKSVLFGMESLLALGSGQYSGQIIGHNPFYFLMFLSIALVFMGKAVSLLNRNADFGWLINSRFAFFIGVGFCISGALLQLSLFTPGNIYIENLGGSLLILGIIVITTRIEKLSGLASPCLVVSGLVIACVAGLLNPALELFYRLTNWIDYLPPLNSDIRKATASAHVLMGVSFFAASLDAIIALSFTGKLLSPFELWKQLWAEDSFVGIIKLTCYLISLIYVLCGQGLVISYCLWIILGIQVLSFLPFWDLWCILTALGIHHLIRVREQRL